MKFFSPEKALRASLLCHNCRHERGIGERKMLRFAAPAIGQSLTSAWRPVRMPEEGSERR